MSYSTKSTIGQKYRADRIDVEADALEEVAWEHGAAIHVLVIDVKREETKKGYMTNVRWVSGTSSNDIYTNEGFQSQLEYRYLVPYLSS